MNPMIVMALTLILILIAIWLVCNSMAIDLLKASLEELFRTAKIAKGLQDQINEAMQKFFEQINKDIDNPQDRVAKIEKENKG